MKNLIAFPVLGLAFILQMAILSRMTLLSGAVDLVLLVLVAWSLQEQVETSWHWAGLAGLLAGFTSGLPPYVPLLAYFLTVGVARFLLRQIWQAPILALFSVTFFATLLMHLVTFAGLFLDGTLLPVGDVLTLVTLPGVFLNLLFILPVHAVIRDLALWVYPVEELA
jgi:cell shape-determining protein MreD